jgi:hypothetical protein
VTEKSRNQIAVPAQTPHREERKTKEQPKVSQRALATD